MPVRDKVKQAWKPYRPSKSLPWDRRRAAHLYRRAGFSATSAELDEAVRIGPDTCIDRLLNPVEDLDAFNREMDAMARVLLGGGDPKRLSAWWLYRMVNTPAPLQEKMTLFWHGHFASSATKVKKSGLMLQQHQLLAAHALGDFRAMVLGITRDPAMLIYLDATSNRRTRPNENYARELMELFCLGEGEYSEQDIQELARCFTGWEVKNGKNRFSSHHYDAGEKHLLGKKGSFNDEAAVDVVLGHPACGPFIARKLIRFFIADEMESPQHLTQPLADAFVAGKYQIKGLVETILRSDRFFSDEALARKVRSPVELSVGLLRSFEGSTNLNEVANRSQQLGQALFFPPSVKGWDGGRAWINASTLIGRSNLARFIVSHKESRFDGKKFDAWMKAMAPDDPLQCVDWLSELLLPVVLPDKVRKNLASCASTQSSVDLIQAFASLPEFQLS